MGTPGRAARPQELTNLTVFKALGTCSESRFLSDHWISLLGGANSAVPSSKRLRETLERLAAAEERAFATEFLAPMLRGGVVQVRIAGVVCRLKVQPDDFEGWGVFRPTSPATAVAGPAGPARRAAAIPGSVASAARDRLPAAKTTSGSAIPAHRADARFRIDGLVPVRLDRGGSALRGPA